MTKINTFIGCLLLLSGIGLADSTSDDIKFKKIVCADSSETAVIKKEVDYPIGGNSSMVKALQQAEFSKGKKFYETGCHNNGPKDDSESLDEMGFQYESKTEKNVYAQTRKIVAYSSFEYFYEGGAHGYYSTLYTTYLKPDGKAFKIDTSDYNDKDKVREILWESLTKNEMELVKELNAYGTTMKKLPITSNVFFEKDSLTFFYGLYEIAPYAWGMPEAKVPYEIIIRNLKPQAAKILKEIKDSFR